jgi:putative NADH-flavin reductase
MRLLILGASGATGLWLTRMAVERGHTVTVAVRSSLAFGSPESVVVKQGAVDDPVFLDRVLPAQDAVLSALGLRRAALNPWARLLSPPDFTSRVAAQLVPAMERHGVRRLLAISAGGVADSISQATWAVQRMVSSGNVGVAYRDLAAMEAILDKSDLDWCAVRPVTLLHGPPRRPAREIRKYSIFSTIRRSEVADWMVREVEKPSPFACRRVLLGR